jgi:hypothetical protein
MKATVVDLRYKMNDVIKALERREEVTILYHGKIKGIIKPVVNKKPCKVSEHPFFAMSKGEKKTVETIMSELRGSRYNDI